METGVIDADREFVRDALASVWPATDAARCAASDDELVRALVIQERVVREAQSACVATVAELQRRGVFAARGQRPDTALAELWGVERFEARRVVTAAEHTSTRVDLQGQVLPARLPGTAEAFAAGAAGLRHVEVIARLLDSATARRLTPDVVAAVERQLASQAAVFTPTELRVWGTNRLELLDQDGVEPTTASPRR